MKSVAWIACVVGLGVLSGCVSQAKYNALLAQNEIQSARIKDLQRGIDQSSVEGEAMRAQLKTLQEARESERRLVGAKEAQIAALQAHCTDLRGRVRDLVDQLVKTPSAQPLPKPVSDALKDLAAREPMLEFDERTGTCKFSSDIVFDTGEDTIKAAADRLLRKFAAIFTGVGKDLYLRIEGHTDDQPIVKPATLKNHPTNWHLSVHRAIAVLRVLYQVGVDQERMCAVGYGRWRPVVENTSDANRAKNRRVEIYVVTTPPAVGPETVSTPEPTIMGGE